MKQDFRKDDIIECVDGNRTGTIFQVLHVSSVGMSFPYCMKVIGEGITKHDPLNYTTNWSRRFVEDKCVLKEKMSRHPLTKVFL